jgi:hypothetical protein
VGAKRMTLVIGMQKDKGGEKNEKLLNINEMLFGWCFSWSSDKKSRVIFCYHTVTSEMVI